MGCPGCTLSRDRLGNLLAACRPTESLDTGVLLSGPQSAERARHVEAQALKAVLPGTSQQMQQTSSSVAATFH